MGKGRNTLTTGVKPLEREEPMRDLFIASQEQETENTEQA